ncbi:MAG: hypothetical protein H0W25_07685 [Acidimicrobiia bacterium]|nr:hypothetical protein [Acidimicrobiia bacterium]
MLAPERIDVQIPDGATAGAVLLHPHPDYGGDRNNNVVDALYRALPAAGIAAVRFDFSSSDLDEGRHDALEALDLLPTDAVVVVVGYSFGAAVAHGIVGARVIGWTLIAAPLGRIGGSGGDAAIALDPRPKLLLVPAHDQYCPPSAARLETRTWKATTIEEIPSSDHFVAGATAEIGRRVASWISAIERRAARGPTAGR